MRAALSNGHTGASPRGRVALVGAGPGSADLLTLRAARLLQEADVIVYDRLVGPDVIDMARRDAQRIYVGKERSRHSRTQAEINALLAHHAAQGRLVVRLKGGDPFVFGRGGEELVHLQDQGIDVEVVPGITAANGCAAGAGIPLTHRGAAEAVTFVTGHGAAGAAPDLDWASLAALGQTLVIYMGIGNADTIAASLMANGRSAHTPVAIVENGSLPNERIVTGRLADLGELVRSHTIEAPALFVIGDVVAVRTAVGVAGGAALAAV